MADYFVSKDGDDSTGDGLSWATAWKTLGKAVSVIGSNIVDNINVGAGVYQENDLWGGLDYACSVTGHGLVVLDGGGLDIFKPIRGWYNGRSTISGIHFVNFGRVVSSSTGSVWGMALWFNCRFDGNGNIPTHAMRYPNFYHWCVFNNCGGLDTYLDANTRTAFANCTFYETWITEQVENIQNCLFQKSTTGDYHKAVNGINSHNCFAEVSADHTLDGETSIAVYQSATGKGSSSFVQSSPFADAANEVLHPANNAQVLGGSYSGGVIGALPYAHVLSPNVNSVAFAAPDHIDNVEQDGDVWKLTSPGVGVLSWYQDLGNTYNVTGIDVIGTITDAGHVWDTDNSDGDLTYLIKGSASPFTPVTSTPSDGVDGWQLANHGESISLASVRYVQVWLVPRTNGVT